MKNYREVIIQTHHNINSSFDFGNSFKISKIKLRFG